MILFIFENSKKNVLFIKTEVTLMQTEMMKNFKCIYN